MTTLILDGSLAPMGTHERVDDLSSVVTIEVPELCRLVYLENTGTEIIRYRLDGTNPTDSVGFRLTPDMGPVAINLAKGESIKLIEESAGAVLEYILLKSQAS